jgi:hypothetical protein
MADLFKQVPVVFEGLDAMLASKGYETIQLQQRG